MACSRSKSALVRICFASQSREFVAEQINTFAAARRQVHTAIRRSGLLDARLLVGQVNFIADYEKRCASGDVVKQRTVSFHRHTISDQ